MLDVAGRKLPSGRAQDVCAGQVWPRQQQRQHVLQLIAETVGAARLIEAGACPKASG